MSAFFRSITFTIPGATDVPNLRVTAVETEYGIAFDVETLDTGRGGADIRGLFFDVSDPAALEGLTVTGADVSTFKTGDVINLGRGVNMNGFASPFDVGIAFGTPGRGGDDIQSTRFFVDNADGTLTLDDIAQVEFGARLTSLGPSAMAPNLATKITTVSPAAPDAVADRFEIFEDGQASKDVPASSASPILFDVLDNDTDADGDMLTITYISAPSHGTAILVDGDDADDLPNDAVLYTPDDDYSGPDNFTYGVSDGNGGTDYATVEIAVAAVADVPDVAVELFATSNANEVRVVVTAETTDTDNSEAIAGISASGLPDGVMLSEISTTPTGGALSGQVAEYLLTLPYDTSEDFDLTFTAVAEEVSNGDQETGSETVRIVSSSQTATANLSFTQTIAAPFDYDPFTVLRGYSTEDDPNANDAGQLEEKVTDPTGIFSAGAWVEFEAGIEERFEFTAGDLTVNVDHEVTVDTFHNGATDVLKIETSSVSGLATWSLDDSISSVELAAILKFAADVYLQADLGELEFRSSLKDFAEALGVLPTIDVDQTIVRFDELTNPDGIFQFPSKLDFLSLSYETLPDISGFGDALWSDTHEFLSYTFDLDEFLFNVAEFGLLPAITTPEGLTTFAGIVAGGVNLNPLDFRVEPFDAGVFIEVALADFDINLDWEIIRDTILELETLTGAIEYEDGTSDTFVFGDTLNLQNASALDANGDGILEYEITASQGAKVSQSVELDPEGEFVISVLDITAGYEGGILGEPTSTGVDPIEVFSLEFDTGDAVEIFDGFDEFDFNQSAIDAEIFLAGVAPVSPDTQAIGLI